MSNAIIRMFDLSDELMRQLSTYGSFPNVLNGITVQIMTGDAQSGMASIFEGTIPIAAADYNQIPDVAFPISAFTGLQDAVKPIPPTTINGAAVVGGRIARGQVPF